MSSHFVKPQTPRAKPSAPPVPDEEDTLRFFDAVIASCDSEVLRKPYVDDGHADVDFIGEEMHLLNWAGILYVGLMDI